ncbi:MAG TPA: helix-turn-helix domain-containing protein [Actinomycetes bacterium]|nr:helix-turn-helix domain-containing protein [Actinomycetes bacterium]
MSDDDFEAQVTGLAALGEQVRRTLYRFVVAHPDPVSRDQAAEGTGVPRHVAKFHLDKLAEKGLLEVEFRRPPGRRGPGAGRPTKLYRRSSRELRVSLPERRYELVGQVMARAIVDAEHNNVPIAAALSRAAKSTGRALGEEARRRAGSRPSQAALLAEAHGMLAEHGYEPRADPDGLTLANCPFHALAQDYTELVCGMNRDLIDGLLTGLERANLEARLDPAPRRCCVTVRRQRPTRKESP